MAKKRVIVSLADTHLQNFDQVIQQSELAGLAVENRHPTIGVLQGTIDEAALEQLSKIEGIKSVEEEHEFHLPSPDSDVQ